MARKFFVWLAIFAASVTAALAQSVQDTYGDVQVSYYRMGASEFSPMESPGLDDYRYTYPEDVTTYRRYGQKPVAYFIGSPHLPSGAKVLGVYVAGCASEANGLFGEVVRCNFYGSACVSLADYSAVAGCGNDLMDVSAASFTVNNGPLGERLLIRVSTIKNDGTDSFAGATIAYQLQVSPAPANATFNDVPPSDFGFQYVEALVAAGITGGTGSGAYSPNAFVTRRQMAVFIAKALGLQWP